MVSSVGSVEDALQDSNHYSEEWTPVIRKRFIKKDKNIGYKKFGISKFQIALRKSITMLLRYLLDLRTTFLTIPRKKRVHLTNHRR
jgi:hypothetical protein